MLDLNREEAAGTLIPWKTRGKSEGGNVFIYAGRNNRQKHVFVPMQECLSLQDGDCAAMVGDGSTYENNGKFVNGESTPNLDIVSLSKPWYPKVGERVWIDGFAVSSWNFQNGKALSSRNGEGDGAGWICDQEVNNGSQFIGVKKEGDMRPSRESAFRTHIRNIRRPRAES